MNVLLVIMEDLLKIPIIHVLLLLDMNIVKIFLEVIYV